MKTGWAVREASEEDAERLSLVGSATFLETFAGLLEGSAIVAHCQQEHSPATYLRYLKSGGFAWLAEAKDGLAPIGFALLTSATLPGSDSGNDLELKRIYALSRFHGAGVGNALLQAVIQRARLSALCWACMLETPEP